MFPPGDSGFTLNSLWGRVFLEVAGWSRDEVQRKGLRLPIALHSYSQLALGILRMAPLTTPFIWEVTKGLL